MRLNRSILLSLVVLLLLLTGTTSVLARVVSNSATFLHRSLEIRIGLFANNDPVNFTDPTGRIAKGFNTERSTHTPQADNIAPGIEPTRAATPPARNAGRGAVAVRPIAKSPFPPGYTGGPGAMWRGEDIAAKPMVGVPPSAVADAATNGAGARIKYIGKIDDLAGIPRSQTLLDDLPNLGSPRANYYQNSSVLRKALRDGYEIRDASAFRLNSSPDPTRLRPDRTIGQSFLGAERNILDNKGLLLNPSGVYVPR